MEDIPSICCEADGDNPLEEPTWAWPEGEVLKKFQVFTPECFS